jgi:acyl-coenzyme A synthetase/AMP-(fatty) acid ligase
MDAARRETVWETWERTVAAESGALIVVEAGSGRAFTRGALHALALDWARRAPAEAAPGETVAFCIPNGAGWLAAFLGAQKLGMAALPLDGALPDSRQRNQAGALGGHWLVEADGRWTRLAADAPAPARGEICLIKTTSGSTGEPKPLPFSSANMLADGRNIIASMGIGPADRNLGAIPFGHSYGLGNLVMPLIVQGTPVIATAEMLPGGLATLVAEFGATVLPSVPAVLRALAESASIDLRPLRRVISAGAPLRAGLAAEFAAKLGLQIHNFYGSTETGGICFDRTGECAGAGTPLDGVQVALDEDGRVRVRSAAVSDALGGEYQLPDLGAWNERGELVLTGRATPLANIGGRKVAPSEIERALRELPGVSDAWVGIGQRAGDEDFLLAAVETRRTRDEIRAMLNGRLPAWQMPRSMWVTDQLPRTPRGKLDRAELERRCRPEF